MGIIILSLCEFPSALRNYPLQRIKFMSERSLTKLINYVMFGWLHSLSFCRAVATSLYFISLTNEKNIRFTRLTDPKNNEYYVQNRNYNNYCCAVYYKFYVILERGLS